MTSIAIIGGGFSGLMSTVHIFKNAKTPVHLHIINSGNEFPRGVAYSTICDWHVLNVRAFNMSAFPDEPNHFINWLKHHPKYINANEDELIISFIPRKIYGEYLISIWEKLQQEIKSSANSNVTVHHSSAVAAEFRNGKTEISLDNNEKIIADKIILATGHSVPTQPDFISDSVATSKFYFGNPWSKWENNFTEYEGDAFIIGSGLTMVDTVLSLLNKKFKGKIYFNSRHGLLPLSHQHFIKSEFLSLNDLPSPRLLDTIKIFRKWVKLFKSEGKPEFLAADKFRAITQQIWRGWTLHEKKYFLRFLKTPWNVARHRIADEVFQTLDMAMKEGKLIYVPGKITSVAENDNGISVQVSKNKNNIQIFRTTHLFNCTGPKDSYKNSTNPFIRSLINSGVAMHDDLDMGLKVADNYAVKNSKGETSDSIFTTGVVIKGSYWESFAVPDLRKQVKAVSENLVMSLSN